MSRYSGKCDVADWLGDYDDGYIQNLKIFLMDEIVPLRIDNQHDLSPYYPFLVAVGVGDVIYLSRESFVDSEEKECLGWMLRGLQKYYRKCKRNKIPYKSEEAISQSCLFFSDEISLKIAKAVEECGNKLTVEDLIDKYGVRSPIHEHYRKTLFDKMTELGWSKEQANMWIWKDWKRG